MKFEIRNPFSKVEEYEQLDPSAGKAKASNEPQDPKSLLDIDRKDPTLLENMMASEPVLFAGTMIWQSLIEDADFRVLVNDEFTQGQIDDIFRYTSLKPEMLEKLPIHFCTFGGWGCEYIKDKRGKIVEFLTLDGKQLYNDDAGFLKYGMYGGTWNKKRGSYPKQVILNNIGRPIGMRRILSYGRFVDYMFPFDMAYLPYIQPNHTQLGYGMVEAAYRDSEIKENLEQGRVQTSIDAAYPKPLIGYGSQFYRPTAEMKKRAEMLAVDIADPAQDWVTYSKAEFEVGWKKPPEAAMKLVEEVMYSTKLQAAVLRIPLALLLQTGENEGGKATLEGLLDFFEYSFRGFQRKMRPHQIAKTVLENNSRYWSTADQAKLDFSGLRTEYGVLSHKAKKEFVMAIQRLGKDTVGLVDKDDPEVRRAVRKALGLRDLQDISPVSPVSMNMDGEQR
jgi:hypothetical protein